MRRGVSLIEVLFAIFIIMFGLLGLCAMLSLGKRAMNDIEALDATTACAKTAYLRVIRPDSNYREFLRPAAKVKGIAGWTWPDMGRFYWNGNSYPTTPTTPADAYTNAMTGPILIDPIGYYENAGVYFPPMGTGPRELLTDTTAPLQINIPRVSLRMVENNTPVAISGAMGRKLCDFQDAPTFGESTEITERPRAMYGIDTYDKDGNRNGRSSVALPRQPGDAALGPGPVIPRYTDYDGGYQWAVFMTPTDTMWVPLARNQTDFRAWLLVYHKRNLDTTTQPPPERTVICNFTGPGINGGEVKLTSNTAEYLNVRKDQWIMLVGVDNSKRGRCEWYKIVSVQRDPVQETTSRWAIDAMLQGVDWPVYIPTAPTVPHWCDKKRDTADPSTFINEAFDTDGDGTANDVIAVIVDGLVAVQGDGATITMPSY